MKTMATLIRWIFKRKRLLRHRKPWKLLIFLNCLPKRVLIFLIGPLKRVLIFLIGPLRRVLIFLIGPPIKVGFGEI